MEKLTKALMTDETGQAIVTKLTALSGQMHELAMATRGSAILFESDSDISVLGDGGYLAVYVGSTNPLEISEWTGDNSLVTGHLYYLVKSGTAVASSDLGEYGGTAVTDTTLSVSGAPADAKTVGDALATKANSADVTALTTVVAGKANSSDVTALGTRVTAVEGDVSDLESDFSDVSDSVSNLGLDVFGEHKTVFASETWQAIAGTDVRENGHSLSVDIPANTDFIVKLVAPDGIFNANKINFYTYNENSEKVNSIYNKSVNTEFTYTSAQALKRITVFISGGDIIGNGDFYLTVSFVEIKSDSLKAQVDEIASEIDAVNGRLGDLESDFSDVSDSVSNLELDVFGEHKTVFTSETWQAIAGTEVRENKHSLSVDIPANTDFTVKLVAPDGVFNANKINFYTYNENAEKVNSIYNKPVNTEFTYTSAQTLKRITVFISSSDVIGNGDFYLTVSFVEIKSNSLKAQVDEIASKIDEKPSVPEYYYTNSYLDNKITRINTLAKSCAATGDSFIFITDEHWPLNQKQSIPLISAINESCHIDKVFSGGDTADGLSEDFCNQLRKAFPHRIYHVAGNHDWFTEDGNLMYYYMDAYNVDQIGNPENHYYYVDNPQKKIRYIVLNRFKQVNGEWINMNNDPDQVSWLTNEALNVESGWGVIVFVHYIAESESVASALDTAKNNGVDVIAIIVGHVHFDMIQHTYGGIPMIYTTCDKNEAWIHDGVNQEPWLTEDRPSGTIYEQAFDVFVVDRINKTIMIVRIGMPAMDNVDIALVSPEWTYHGTLEERVVTYT